MLPGPQFADLLQSVLFQASVPPMQFQSVWIRACGLLMLPGPQCADLLRSVLVQASALLMQFQNV